MKASSIGSVGRNIATISALATLLIACGSSSGDAPIPTTPGPTTVLPSTQNIPYDSGTGPEDRDVPFLAWHEDLSVDGYMEEEILMSGTAQTYEYIDGLAESPLVQPTETDPAPYTTRILIRRPINAADFNGVVYMELLNATARYDGAPMWNLTYPSMIQDGAAWVGVTFSGRTIQFMRDEWGIDAFPSPAGSQPRNRSRYATLSITNRAHTWDILNQAAALLKADDDSRNPMQGFAIDTIIATGYSQSARYVNTFANSFFPSYSEASPCTEELQQLNQCIPIVDGYIVAAGGPVASQLNGAGSHPRGDRRNCENALNRQAGCLETEIEPKPAEDAPVYKLPKIMRYTTESDISSARVRQDKAFADGTQDERYQPLLRTYEVAGTSHADYWGSVVGNAVGAYQFGTAGPVSSSCDLPLNPLRTGIPLSAIQHRLARWIQYDELPPDSAFMEWEGDFNLLDELFRSQVSWRRDDGDTDDADGDFGMGDGNALYGVRPPRINVPLGKYLGSNQYTVDVNDENYSRVLVILCGGIIGGFDAFSAEELEARYTNHMTYVDLTWWEMWQSFDDGFLLPVDALTIINEAVEFDGLPD